jgi:hypothetical protein
MICPRCGAENPDHAQYCGLCLEVIEFEDQYAMPIERSNEGLLTHYPSSFDGDAEIHVTTKWSSPCDAFSAPRGNEGSDKTAGLAGKGNRPKTSTLKPEKHGRGPVVGRELSLKSRSNGNGARRRGGRKLR